MDVQNLSLAKFTSMMRYAEYLSAKAWMDRATQPSSSVIEKSSRKVDVVRGS